jgi:glycosyltransferase involved in cell wall biosynthesis
LEKQGGVIEKYRAKRVLTKNYDIWHIHWPEAFFNKSSFTSSVFHLAGLIFLLIWARLNQIRIIWTIHNLQSHEVEYPVLERLAWPLFSFLVHGTISLSEHAKQLAFGKWPWLRRKPATVIPHGHYRDVYPETKTQEQAKNELGLESEHHVALYFGRIRKYKRVPGLIQSFKKVIGEDLRLLVVGNPESRDLRYRVRAAVSGDKRIITFLEFIPNNEVQKYFLASDVVLFPQEEFLNSGSVVLALTYNRPVLAAQEGSVVELQDSVGNRWIKLFKKNMRSSDIEEAINWAKSVKRNKCEMKHLSWSDISKSTLSFFKKVCKQNE